MKQIEIPHGDLVSRDRAVEDEKVNNLVLKEIITKEASEGKKEILIFEEKPVRERLAELETRIASLEGV